MFSFWNRRHRTPFASPTHKGLFTPIHRFERAAYLKAVAAVAAKLAKADGPVQRSEIDCFKQLFPLEPHEKSVVAPIFDLASESPAGFRPFARLLVEMIAGDAKETRSLFDRFHRIALADGALTDGEQEFLTELAEIFRVSEYWNEVQRNNTDRDPYSVLGVTRDISDEDLRVAWHRLIRQFHPDALAARGEKASSHAQVAAINAAYKRIVRARRGRAAQKA